MPLKIGTTNIESIYKGTKPIDKIYKGTTLVFESAKWIPYSFEYLYHDLIPQKVNKNAELPQEYQEVEYIESSGTQYIDTGVSITNDIKVDIAISFNQLGSGSNENIICSNGNYGNDRFLLLTSSKSLMWFGNIKTITTDLVINTKYDIEITKTYVALNGTQTATTDSSSGTLYLLASTGGSRYFYGKLYSCKIYNNGTLVRNFIPCYRKSDNVIGLYDSVNGVFYTNAGTGTFTKGNDVSRDVKNKLKVAKIYGHSEVVNQLVADNFGSSTSYWAKNRLSQANNNNVATFTTTSNAYSFCSFYHSFQGGELPKNHHLLYSVCIRITSGNCSQFEIDHHGSVVDSITNPTLNTWYRLTGIIKQTRENNETTNGFDCVRRYANTSDIVVNSDTFEAKEPMIIDLTQEYPFDTPTALTDNRVQNILNRGYIAHNTGEIKSVDIGELESDPYNLFDEEVRYGLYAGDGNFYTSATIHRVCNVNKIKVLPNTTYYGNGVYQLYRYEYDKNGNFLREANAFRDSFTTSSDCYYINISTTSNVDTYLNDISISRVNLGYKPHNFGLSHARSLLGKQNIPYTFGSSSANVSFYPTIGDSFVSAYSSQVRTCRRLANHKYFLYAKIDNTTYSWSLFGIWDTYSTGYDGNRTTPTQTGNELYCIISPTTSVNEGVPVIQFGGSNYNDLTPKAMCILDLTELGLDTLTEAQVYTKVKDYLDQLCNGETLGILPFKAQLSGVGTSQDSLEKTNTEWVFTKNNANVDLLNLNFSYQSASSRWYVSSSGLNVLGVNNSVVPNILSEKYIVKSFTNANSDLSGFCIGSGTNPTIFLYTSDNVNQPSGTIEYQLATPQVIHIPLKHLKIVDLGSFDWSYNSSQQRFNPNTQIPNMATISSNNTVANIVCSKYLTSSYNNLAIGNISLNTNGYIYIKDTSTTSTTDFKNAMQGVYLFYETQNEVADIPVELLIDAGGTLTSNMFSWVENQLVSNGNFSNGTTGWSTINGTASVSNNVLTQTLTAIGSHKYGNGLNVGNFEPPLNHKYLCVGYVKPKYNGTCYIGCGYTENISSDISITANQWNKIVAIITNTTNSGANNRFTLAVDCTSNYQIGDSIEYKELECIDITLGFGNGDIPTSINDPRIQEILRLGYIPTNDVGEWKAIDPQVLPSVDTKVKCK